MNDQLPFAEACERNKQPILEVLEQEFPRHGKVLEIGSATGQHVVYFAPRFPGLSWQPSDRREYLDGLQARIRQSGAENIETILELDVLGDWPARRFEAIYSSNTAHIMSWEAVQALFRGVGEHLLPGGVFCLYGPFNENGQYTSGSNAEFDRHLKSRDPNMGLRDIEVLDSLAQLHQLFLASRHPMPANNQVLVFRKNRES